MSDFNLGDFIETLPYEGGPGSADEYIANNLLAKRLKLRNEELKENLAAEDKAYLPSTDQKHYINVSERENYVYSAAVLKLEEELATLTARIKARKDMERTLKHAKPAASTKVLTVNKMTDEILRRIKLGESIEEADDDL
jgi:hypothetical protein